MSERTGRQGRTIEKTRTRGRLATTLERLVEELVDAVFRAVAESRQATRAPVLKGLAQPATPARRAAAPRAQRSPAEARRSVRRSGNGVAGAVDPRQLALPWSRDSKPPASRKADVESAASVYPGTEIDALALLAAAEPAPKSTRSARPEAAMASAPAPHVPALRDGETLLRAGVIRRKR